MIKNIPVMETENLDKQIQSVITSRVSSLMKKDKIRGKHIAIKMSRSPSWFSQIMKNKRGLSFGDLWKIAGLLGVSPATLLPLEAPPARPIETIDEQIERKVLSILEQSKKK